MPELPEVETTRRGIEPSLTGQRVANVVVRNPNLRWKVPAKLNSKVVGQTLNQIRRRAKYLLLDFDDGSIIAHLGMSGSLRIVDQTVPIQAHDHVDIVFENNKVLRYRDPRRFGCVLWSDQPEHHELLRDLGPEPFDDQFSVDYLFEQSRGRKSPIKTFIMDNHVVVGVGNIYANEALYYAGVRPMRRSGSLTRGEANLLVSVIKRVLMNAIEAGGTTLRDFYNADGNPGYFVQQLAVYGRENEKCERCNHLIKAKRIGQRNSYYCPRCQK